ncbi:nuclear transport factor 2 family protein [Rapidithrix thailandica]|uniref:Nuclear transport factor 2 family protein n=1 Tax=Rapidithrix thailandica TaxID=413964 RepID=A0AAW9RXR2_9BACT
MKTKKNITWMVLVALFSLTENPLAAQTENNEFAFEQVKSNTMENQAKLVVKEFLTAVQHGDHETLGALLHPEVEWSQPGNNRFSGIKQSSAEVFQMVGGMFKRSENTLALTHVKAITVNGNEVACLVHWEAAQPVGATLNVDNIDVYTVENGKIVKVNVFSADLAQEDHFWGK